MSYKCKTSDLALEFSIGDSLLLRHVHILQSVVANLFSNTSARDAMHNKIANYKTLLIIHYLLRCPRKREGLNNYGCERHQ